MSNIDKQALRIPERKKHNWSQAVMRDCDFCQQWALTVRHSDGGSICACCCDSEYTTALYSALVVALDELEAKDQRIAELEAREVVLPSTQDVHPLGPQSAKIFCEFHRSIVNRCADEIRKVGVKVSIKGN